ncbi:hypothetical protein D3C80_1913860 [compost metagenome]
MRWSPLGGQGKQPLWVFAGDKSGVIGVAPDIGEFMIIQAGAAQPFVIPWEAHRLYQMQLKASIGAQADNIAGIGWNFRFK